MSVQCCKTISEQINYLSYNDSGLCSVHAAVNKVVSEKEVSAHVKIKCNSAVRVFLVFLSSLS